MAEAADKPTRVEIGFNGGQVIAARLSPKQLTELRGKLGKSGWHDVTTEDGDVALDLGQVVFVRGEASDHSVGFSGA